MVKESLSCPPWGACAGERREGRHRHDGAPPDRLCGVRGGLKSGMDEPRRHLHGCADGGLWRRQGGREEKWRRWLGLGRRPSLVCRTLFGGSGSFIK
jgi:hypothetical protein